MRGLTRAWLDATGPTYSVSEEELAGSLGYIPSELLGASRWIVFAGPSGGEYRAVAQFCCSSSRTGNIAAPIFFAGPGGRALGRSALARENSRDSGESSSADRPS